MSTFVNNMLYISAWPWMVNEFTDNPTVSRETVWDFSSIIEEMTPVYDDEIRFISDYISEYRLYETKRVKNPIHQSEGALYLPTEEGVLDPVVLWTGRRGYAIYITWSMSLVVVDMKTKEGVIYEN